MHAKVCATPKGGYQRDNMKQRHLPPRTHLIASPRRRYRRRTAVIDRKLRSMGCFSFSCFLFVVSVARSRVSCAFFGSCSACVRSARLLVWLQQTKKRSLCSFHRLFGNQPTSNTSIHGVFHTTPSFWLAWLTTACLSGLRSNVVAVSISGSRFVSTFVDLPRCNWVGQHCLVDLLRAQQNHEP